MSNRSGILPLLAALLGVCAASHHSVAQEIVRIATYNIKYLDEDDADNAARMASLHQTLDLLDAHVIGLQEIDDAAALDTVFPDSQWIRVIDQDSGWRQDLALVARRGVVRVVGAGTATTIDADKEHFLFEDADDEFFPRNRDVLCIEFELVETGDTFFVMVVHAKSRHDSDEGEGRATNDHRREGAAILMVQHLEQAFDGERYAVVGDFNDTPDDRSLNILESGDPNAAGRMENDEGAFLVNLCEPLAALDHVTLGRNTLDIQGDTLDTVDPGSRARNDALRGTNEHTGDGLFDQILVSRAMREHYVLGSARVFDRACAARGNSITRASDHLPVFAEFVFASAEEDDAIAHAPRLEIARALPNPTSTDAGAETVTIRNAGAASASLVGHTLRDRAGHTLALSGTLGAGAEVTILIPSGKLPLNNSGDDLELLDPSGIVIDAAAYTRSQVREGVEIAF